MSLENNHIQKLRESWSFGAGELVSNDYVLLDSIDLCFAARSRSGKASFVIPLTESCSSMIGRCASGCELVGYRDLQFVHHDREWSAPAAALVCVDDQLLDVFAVLCADIANRLGSAVPPWPAVLAIVEEWQALLAPRGRLNAEAELGLWAELWVIEQSIDVTRTLEGWRGPEHDSVDFFIDAMALEVKASRVRRQHQVSQSQVERPAGVHEAWFLSFWAKVDPVGGVSVPELADLILDRAANRASVLRLFALGGYVAADRRAYSQRFILMAEPEWYRAEDIPRVRSADEGVSMLRYRIDLEEAARADEGRARFLWQHFMGREHQGVHA
jgi:hypothetical protein